MPQGMPSIHEPKAFIHHSTIARCTSGNLSPIPESTACNEFNDNSSRICAKLVTIRDGRKEAIVLSISKPVTIGRDPERCSYVVTDTLVSGVHCKLYAVRSPSRGVIISCQDLSRNGIYLNGQHIRKTNIILMDGDELELPNSISSSCFKGSWLLTESPRLTTNAFKSIYMCTHLERTSGQTDYFRPHSPVAASSKTYRWLHRYFTLSWHWIFRYCASGP